MNTTWNVYYENADTDEPKRFIGTFDNGTILSHSQALQLASVEFNIPEYDLVVIRKDVDNER